MPGFYFRGLAMNLKDEIELAIKLEAEKLSERHHNYHNLLHLDFERERKRVASVPPKVVQIPQYWSSDPKFNPFYVHKRRNSIARSIAAKITAGTYRPHAPFAKQVDKVDGSFRNISVYEIPDAAVSALWYEKLLRKNIHRFSGKSYAYRNDRNAHFAIQDISTDLSDMSRIFIAEYDFSKFFDSISHAYLYDQFDRNGFSISSTDRHIVRAFLGESGKGVPQGTSISLFLANLVCWKLDREFEDEGLRFARYADDTIIWSSDYSKISAASNIMGRFSRHVGVEINASKSKGIRLLCDASMPSEFSGRAESIEFLGYSITARQVGMKPSSVKKIKRQIAYVLYTVLLQPLQSSPPRNLNVPANGEDVDLISAVSSIRRYLYGDLHEDFIKRFLGGSTRRLFYKGVMSFYPLVTDKAQMQALDGWLVSIVWRVLKRRSRLLVRLGIRRHLTRFPYNVYKRELAIAFRSHRASDRRPYALPSFVMIYLALRKAVSEEGLQELLGKDDY